MSSLKQIYRNMIYRCYSPNVTGATARNYRDKGIRVCDAWIASFRDFERWAMSNGYEDGLSIDRIDPNSNYCPENCRWVTISENRAYRGAAAVDARGVGKKYTPEQMNELEKLSAALAAVPAQVRVSVANEATAYVRGYAAALAAAEAPQAPAPASA